MARSLDRSPEPLPAGFFRRRAEEVASSILGHYLVRRVGSDELVLRIVESEAYLGEGDRASHAWRGRPEGRAASLFRPGGVAYVYLIYGIHYLFNVVAGDETDGSAVLIRAGEPKRGEETMMRNRGLDEIRRAGDIAGGPGRLSQAMAIGASVNGSSLDRGSVMLCRGRSLSPQEIASGPRIGVGYAGDAARWPLRFAERGNPHVSRPYPW